MSMWPHRSDEDIQRTAELLRDAADCLSRASLTAVFVDGETEQPLSDEARQLDVDHLRAHYWTTLLAYGVQPSMEHLACVLIAMHEIVHRMGERARECLEHGVQLQANDVLWEVIQAGCTASLQMTYFSQHPEMDPAFEPEPEAEVAVYAADMQVGGLRLVPIEGLQQFIDILRRGGVNDDDGGADRSNRGSTGSEESTAGGGQSPVADEVPGPGGVDEAEAAGQG